MEPDQQQLTERVGLGDAFLPLPPKASTSRPESANPHVNPSCPSTEQTPGDFTDDQNFDTYQKLGNELNYSIKTLERTHLTKLNLLARIRHDVEGLRHKRHLQRTTMDELQTNVESLTLTKKAAEKIKYAERKNNLEFLQIEFNAVSENYTYIENVVEKIHALLEKDEGNSRSLLADMRAEYDVQLTKSFDFEREIDKCFQKHQARTEKVLEEKRRDKTCLLETLRLCKDHSSNKEMFELERQQKLSTLQTLDRENQNIDAQILESNRRLIELNGKTAQMSADWKIDREFRYDTLAKKKSSIDTKRQLVESRLQALKRGQAKVKSESKERENVENRIAAMEAQLECLAAEVQELTIHVDEMQEDDRRALCDDLEANNAPLAEILEHLKEEISEEQKEMIESLLLVNGDANNKELILAAGEENLATMKFQIDMLKREMCEKSKEIEDIKGKSDDLRVELALLKDDERLRDLQNKISKSKDHYDALEKKIVSTRENLKKADAEIKALEAEIVSLDDQLAGLDADEESVTKAEDDQRLIDVQQAIEQSRREIEEIKSKVETKMKVEDVEAEVNQVLSDLERRKTENAEETAQMEAKLDEAQHRAQGEVEKLQISFQESMKPLKLEIEQTEKKVSRMEEELNNGANLLSANTQMTVDMIKERLSLVEKLIEEFGRLESTARVKKERSRSLQVMAKIKEHLATTFHGINKCLDKPPFVGTPSYAIYRRRLDVFHQRFQDLDSARTTRCSDPNFQRELANWAYNFFGIQSFSGFGSELFSSPDFDFY